MARRFPHPIPSGTRVPQWALIDITVRCYVFLQLKCIHNFTTLSAWGHLEHE